MSQLLRWVDLAHPVDAEGRLVTSISFRVPTAEEVARVRELATGIKRGSANTKIMIQIAQVLANTEPETIRKLHLDDLHRALAVTLEILRTHTRPTR